jgi:beta-xylosidase
LKWSLTQNPGNLRLLTSSVVSNLRDARNTLTQRIFAYYSTSPLSSGSVKMNIGNMLEGDVAGLAVFQDPYAYIGIKKINGINYIIMVNNGKTIDSTIVKTTTVYLEACAGFGTGKASFFYSLDNKVFYIFGNELEMKFNLSVFTGNKFCLFNYATLATGGYVDFDWFKAEVLGEKYDYIGSN